MADTSPWSLFSPFQEMIERFFYAPSTNWGRFFNPQVVFNYNPEDVGVESHVLSRVGSYGKQLSTIIDAVAALERGLAKTPLDAAQRDALKQFNRLRENVDGAVSEYQDSDPEHLVKRITVLRERDPQAFATVHKAVLDMEPSPSGS